MAAEGETEHCQSDEVSRARAILAYELLLSWRTPPGLENDEMDGCQLESWLDEARSRLAEKQRCAVGDELIGQMLNGSPPGTDGAWPAEPVRGVIERLKSDELDSGLSVGRRNQCGVVSRNPLMGGEIERNIKAQYEADAAKLAARWPRTAAILRALAVAYERDAAREDVQAELRHDPDD